MTPRTLSELVPAQTLAKALLEAEAAIEWNQTLLRMAVKPEVCVTRDDNQKSAADIYKSNSEALAQIQRIKKGDMV